MGIKNSRRRNGEQGIHIVLSTRGLQEREDSKESFLFNPRFTKDKSRFFLFQNKNRRKRRIIQGYFHIVSSIEEKTEDPQQLPHWILSEIQDNFKKKLGGQKRIQKSSFQIQKII